MINVFVTVGIGMWKVYRETTLVACPHVGDQIIVDDFTVTCEHVAIGKDKIYVQQTIRFQAESDLDPYVEAGWKR